MLLLNIKKIYIYLYIERCCIKRRKKMNSRNSCYEIVSLYYNYLLTTLVLFANEECVAVVD